MEAQLIHGTGFESRCCPKLSGDAFSGLVQTAILGSPDFPFVQAAMEALDVAVAFWMMVRRAAKRDAQYLIAAARPFKRSEGIGGSSPKTTR